MAGGWSRDGAVQEHIDATIAEAIERSRGQLPQGESLTECAACGGDIPEARRAAVPGVRLCVTCQSDQDVRSRATPAFNRRGSKDSQLR